MDPHLQRLKKGAEALNLEVPWDISHIRDEVLDYIEKAYPSGADRAIFYLQVTRGEVERYHPQPEEYEPNMVMTIREFAGLEEEKYEEGVSTITVADDRWSKCHIKTIALLPNTLAKTKALNNGAFDAIYIRDGFVMEGTHTNMFAVKDGTFLTPPATNYILNGVTRREIFKVLDKEGLEWEEACFEKRDLYNMDEAFLSGTLIDVVPIVEVDDQQIGDGKPGEMTKKLMDLFQRHKKNKLKAKNKISVNT